MSVQVAKSTNGTGAAGRLSLSTTTGPTTRGARTQSTDSDKESSTNRETSSNANKTVSKNEKNDNTTTTDAKKSDENSDNKPKGENKTTENLNSAKEKEQNKKDDKKQKDEKKQKDDRKQQNGVEETKDSKIIGSKGEEVKKSVSQDKSDIKINVRESPRRKDVREKEEKKEENQEKRKGEARTEKEKEDKKPSAKSDEDKQKSVKKDKDEKAIPNKGNTDKEKEKISEVKVKLGKQPETPKKNEKKAKDLESVTPPKQLEHKDIKETRQVKSLADDNKDTKGLSLDGDDMESLVFEPESDQNGPTGTSTPGKVLKMKSTPACSNKKPSEFKTKLDEEKVISSATFASSNLHKTKHSEKTLPSISSESSELYQGEFRGEKSASSTSFTSESVPTERPYYVSSLRSITGRRSLRPMKEYSFQSTYRESYRKINTELDCTSSSMNVTVGSEIPQNESTFSFFTRAKKRERTPPVQASEIQNDTELSPKSPKRARMDFSGILGFVSSPVSLLRAKFSKTKIQCSTPNGKVTSKEEEEGVENVSVIAAEEITSDIAEDVNIKDVESADNNEDSIKDVEIEEDNTNVDVVIKKEFNIASSMESVNKRQMCSIM